MNLFAVLVCLYNDSESLKFVRESIENSLMGSCPQPPGVLLLAPGKAPDREELREQGETLAQRLLQQR